MSEHGDIQWAVLRPDQVVEIMASERLARNEAAREGGQVICRDATDVLPGRWHRAELDVPAPAAA